ncbi:hypothetical protein OIU84_010050 [Salix udensis]|uniref:Uncharacterized protein n=1 Tax=Salix udensis TaxID=889485 RepID=A0AAD6NV24_9ROSI|nr:hypothetical protein OIU84_010050 [Salix udensis]
MALSKATLTAVSGFSLHCPLRSRCSSDVSSSSCTNRRDL